MEPKERSVFPVGKPNDTFAQYFIGQSYLNMLSTEQVAIGNVTFEPGCRNNWHIHHAKSGGGQILLVTAGRGWYQEWGKPPRALRPGDVVNIPAEVKHWHGAAADPSTDDGYWVHTLNTVFEELEALGLSKPVPKPEPKKRGRKPKPKDQSDLKPKQPRGRPRKNANQSAGNL